MQKVYVASISSRKPSPIFLRCNNNSLYNFVHGNNSVIACTVSVYFEQYSSKQFLSNIGRKWSAFLWEVFCLFLKKLVPGGSLLVGLYSSKQLLWKAPSSTTLSLATLSSTFVRAIFVGFNPFSPPQSISYDIDLSNLLFLLLSLFLSAPI